jgi:hypothetical protein
MLAQRLVQGGGSFAEAWNFSPGDDKGRPISALVQRLAVEMVEKPIRN